MKPKTRLRNPRLTVLVLTVMCIFGSVCMAMTPRDEANFKIPPIPNLATIYAKDTTFWIVEMPSNTEGRGRITSVISRSQRPIELIPLASGDLGTRIHQPMRSPDDLDDLLQQDPDVLALINIREEMTARAVARNVSPAALKTAYRNADSVAIADLLGYSENDIKDLAFRLDSARLAILKRYPEIAQLAKDSPQGACGLSPSAGTCNSDRLFDNFPFTPIPLFVR